MFNHNPVLLTPKAGSIDECEMLAKASAHQARLLLQMAGDAHNAAVEMWRRAKEHQRTAAELNGGVLPDIGEELFL